MRGNVRGFIGALTLGAALLFSACSDLPTAPEPVDIALQEELLDNVLYFRGNSGPAVEVLERRDPLEKDRWASDVIGPEGGKIRLGKVGLTIHFPRGAVLHPTEITILAPAGKLVGYDFQPHGLAFQEPVIVVQDLRKTNAPRHDASLGPRLVAAYFEGELSASVFAKEVRPFKKHGRFGVFAVQHFSGYVIATD